jgi:adenosine/AMP kinase
MELTTVSIEKPDSINFILGQSHFIKTVEDLHEALVTAVPGIQFGLAFCEASGPALVRWSGTSPVMIELAQQNALALSAGHAFIVFLGNCFPVNVNAVKPCPGLPPLRDSQQGSHPGRDRQNRRSPAWWME